MAWSSALYTDCQHPGREYETFAFSRICRIHNGGALARREGRLPTAVGKEEGILRTLRFGRLYCRQGRRELDAGCRPWVE
eukprot:3294208-Amphidinium_carterae.1